MNYLVGSPAHAQNRANSVFEVDFCVKIFFIHTLSRFCVIAPYFMVVIGS